MEKVDDTPSKMPEDKKGDEEMTEDKERKEEKEAKKIDEVREEEKYAEKDKEKDVTMCEDKTEQEKDKVQEAVTPIVEKLPSDDELLTSMWDVTLSKEEILANNFRIQVKRADLMTLKGTRWLSDNIITYYLGLLTERSAEQRDLPKLYSFNTFFLQNLMSKGHIGVARWTRKINIFEKDMVFVPMFKENHWTLLVIQLRERRIQFYDSLVLTCGDRGARGAALDYLGAKAQCKGVSFDRKGWNLEIVIKNVAPQKNTYDCGVFVNAYAEASSRRAAFTLNQEDMQEQRKIMALEILTGVHRNH